MSKHDVTQMSKYNLTDTCAVWNILSSNCLYYAVLKAGFQFMITPFILYECLYKKRQVGSSKDDKQKVKLQRERHGGRFKEMNMVSIDDLQSLNIINNRKRLSKGELTAVASLLKFPSMGFITDDQDARKMAAKVIEVDRVKTTPLLLGWLFYHEHLDGSDIDFIIKEHQESIDSEKGNLSKYFYEMFSRATQQRVMNQSK